MTPSSEMASPGAPVRLAPAGPSGTRPAARGAGRSPRTLTIMIAMALSLLTSSLALADPPGDGGHDGRDHHGWRHDGGDHRRDDGDHRDWRRDGDHRDDRDHRDWHRDGHDRGDRRDDRWRAEREDRYRERFDSGYYVRPHGYYVHEWHRGERLPIAFRAPAYVIPDIAIYHLRPPPPGYYWVRVNNNAVLAAVTTGVVVSIAYNLFH
jgi:Ni/Co efflux regulator RcnB